MRLPDTKNSRVLMFLRIPAPMNMGQKFLKLPKRKIKELLKLLGISDEVNFIRTTDPHHVKAAQEFWKLCDKRGFIYKKNYEIKYCVGCELEKTESELVDG